MRSDRYESDAQQNTYVHIAPDDSPTFVRRLRGSRLTSKSLLKTAPLITLPFDGGSCRKNPAGGDWKLKAQTYGRRLSMT